jgi:Putative beta-barrel porin-2, OmpL-like. bbp2
VKAAPILSASALILFTASVALADDPAAPAPAPVAAPAPAPAPDAKPVAQAEPPVGEVAPAPAVTSAAKPEEAVAAKVETPEAATPPITVNVFASSSYLYNFNKPADKKNGVRTFDDDNQSLRLDGAELVLQHATTGDNSFGFRADVVAGAAIPRVEAACGLFRPAGDECVNPGADIDLQQAFVSYVAKDGLRFDVGKFITHMGYEVIEGYDGYGDNYSHSYLFGFSIPFTHTGIKISRPLGDMVSASLLLVNGWDNVKDNNDKPSLGAQVVVTPSSMFQIYLNAIGGPERADSDDLRNVFNLIGIAKVTDKTTLTLDTVYGMEANAIDGMDDASWYGAALYAKQQLTDALALTLRGEYFIDDGGARTGKDQKLMEVTFTPAWAITSGFLLRGDVRFDKSNQKAFVGEDAVADADGAYTPDKDTQFTVGANVIAFF